MYDIRFRCPNVLQTQSHVRDASLWNFVEEQDACTIENIEVTTDEFDRLVVQVLFGDTDAQDPKRIASFLTQFALTFPD